MGILGHSTHASVGVEHGQEIRRSNGELLSQAVRQSILSQGHGGHEGTELGDRVVFGDLHGLSVESQGGPVLPGPLSVVPLIDQSLHLGRHGLSRRRHLVDISVFRTSFTPGASHESREAENGQRENASSNQRITLQDLGPFFLVIVDAETPEPDTVSIPQPFHEQGCRPGPGATPLPDLQTAPASLSEEAP
jgi:hypothetical protein